MNYLLDTHAWLWFVLGDAKLSAPAKAAILDPANAKFVSPASLWEISIKISLGKFALSLPYNAFMRQAIAGNNFSLLPITPEHTEQVALLPYPPNSHRDPFDCLLIAQAKAERMTIISSDAALGAYGVPIVW